MQSVRGIPGLLTTPDSTFWSEEFHGCTPPEQVRDASGRAEGMPARPPSHFPRCIIMRAMSSMKQEQASSKSNWQLTLSMRTFEARTSSRVHTSTALRPRSSAFDLQCLLSAWKLPMLTLKPASSSGTCGWTALNGPRCRLRSALSWPGSAALPTPTWTTKR